MFVTSNIEEFLAYSCAPCFAGLKPANLVSIPASLCQQLSSLDVAALNSKGFFIKELCRCKKCSQILLYNKKELEALFFQKELTVAIEEFGYSCEQSLDEKLNRLAERMCHNHKFFGCKKKASFPHEIGFFLGYPVYDVLEYYKNSGKDYLFSGYWKVYSNPEKAAEIFSLYNECKKHFALQIQNGLGLYDLLSA